MGLTSSCIYVLLPCVMYVGTAQNNKIDKIIFWKFVKKVILGMSMKKETRDDLVQEGDRTKSHL